MGWQRTASVGLVSAFAGALAASAFWTWRGSLSQEIPNSDHFLVHQRLIRAPGAALAIPVIGVQPRDIADTFTQSRAAGARRHDAIDIMAPAGTPVVAAAAGTLERLHTSEEGGLTLYVRSPNRRFETYYAHLQAYAPDLHEGQAVRLGQLLGWVGSTGNASPDAPHLHFSVERKRVDGPFNGGVPLNPYPLLTGRR